MAYVFGENENTMSVTVIHTLPEGEWRRFVDEHPAGNIFHTPEMFQVFAQAKGHRPSLWAAVDESGRPLALLLPVEITLRDGLLRQLTTRAVVYGSVLCAPNSEGKQALDRLLRTFKQETKRSVLFTELRNLTDLKEIQPVLKDCDFAYEDHLNLIVDLRQMPERMWNRLDPNARSNIKKARKKGLVVEEAVLPEIVRTSYSLLQEVYDRIRVPLADYSLFQAAFDILRPKGMAKFFMARTGDACIGTSIVLLYKDVVYGWYASASREYSSYKAGDLLNWHVLEWGAQNGYSSFDFGGAGKPDEDYGPRKFKAKFGGTLVNYGRNICVHAPSAFSISKRAYALMRRFSSTRWAK
jgi:lipid II:glycine glycyltransferase (peptidoglycan interpeptide bridge formation enzyme)